jgi:hypothetical protein
VSEETPVTICKLPSVKVALAILSKELRVQKLLVGVSVVWSIDVRLLTVKSLPLPEVSSPSAELSLNSRKNPLVP